MHTRVLIVPGGMQESQRQGGRCEDEAECGGTWGREPRNAGSLLEQERSKNQILPCSLQTSRCSETHGRLWYPELQEHKCAWFKPLHL